MKKYFWNGVLIVNVIIIAFIMVGLIFTIMAYNEGIRYDAELGFYDSDGVYQFNLGEYIRDGYITPTYLETHLDFNDIVNEVFA